METPAAAFGIGVQQLHQLWKAVHVFVVVGATDTKGTDRSTAGAREPEKSWVYVGLYVEWCRMIENCLGDMWDKFLSSPSNTSATESPFEACVANYTTQLGPTN